MFAKGNILKDTQAQIADTRLNRPKGQNSEKIFELIYIGLSQMLPNKQNELHLR